MSTIKHLKKQLEIYLLILMSRMAHIDDFSCSEIWEHNKSLWYNAGKIATYQEEHNI